MFRACDSWSRIGAAALPFYADAESFYSVMRDLFGQILVRPGLLRPLHEKKVLLQITTTQPDALLVLDARSTPPRFCTGQKPDGRPSLGLHLPADVLHEVWLSKIRLRDAYSAGKLQLDTSPLKALGYLVSVMDLFRYTEQIYGETLRRRGLLAR